MLFDTPIIVSDALSETPFSFNQVYSMIMNTKSSEYLYQMATGENRVEKERERERDSSALMEWETEHFVYFLSHDNVSHHTLNIKMSYDMSLKFSHKYMKSVVGWITQIYYCRSFMKQLNITIT